MQETDFPFNLELADVSVCTISGHAYSIRVDANASLKDFQTELANVSGIPKICQSLLFDTQQITEVTWRVLMQRCIADMQGTNLKAQFYSRCYADAFEREAFTLACILSAKLHGGTAGTSYYEESYQVQESERCSQTSITLVVTLEHIFACIEKACTILANTYDYSRNKPLQAHGVDMCKQGLRELSRYAGLNNEDALGVVYKLCNHRHADVRAASTLALPEMVDHGNERAIDELLARLLDGGHLFRGSFKSKHILHPVRLAAIEGIGKISLVGNTSVISGLTRVVIDLEELDSHVVAAAIHVLARIARKGDRKCILTLIHALSLEQDSIVVRAAVLSLQELAPIGDKDSISALFKVMRDEEGDIPDLACMALKEISMPNDPETIRLLKNSLMYQNSRLRRLAIEIMIVVAERGNEDAVVAVLGFGGDPNWKVRQVVLTTLCQIGKEGDPRVRSLLETRLKDWDSRVRNVASDVIGKLSRTH